MAGTVTMKETGEREFSPDKYEPEGCIVDLFYDKSETIAISGPAGTGKSRGVLEKCHLMLQKYDGAVGLMARKTRHSMTHTCITTFNKFVKQDDKVCKWRAQDQEYLYANGSKFVVSGLDNPTKLLSAEYDFVYFQQAEEISLSAFEEISTRLRAGAIPYQQLLLDVNPADPNHWIKRLEKEGKLKMYYSWHKDNPVFWNKKKQEWTARGAAYMARLQDLSGVRRQRLYEGLWVSAEGAVYPEFNTETHVIPQFKPPKGAVHIWGVDFGFNDPFVWQDWILTDAGNLVLCNEYYHTHKTVDEAAHEIASFDFNRDESGNLIQPWAIICDTDAEGRAQLEKAWDMMTLPAFKKIREGIQGVHARLDPGRGRKPRLFIMEDCLAHTPDPELVFSHKPLGITEEFSSYSYAKEPKPGKVEIPVDLYNHSMDVMRYVVAFVDDLGIDPHDINELMEMDEDNMVHISPV